ncbi:peptidoglycan-associated lipoprotein Pal [Altererythrobacter salegens]|uniref:Peptidoglycan-associated lipoprotein n=1 Tax=Croceibacterium salegens TaxID=1737568 RepID=A0A6I4SV09_9SPHN|nr:peptidoglycan-associated lipoprotein Pal [Croceibacterium salegens]MXO58192.1 peptidoglycan-associated lipoprotein Pal [Croceibacterium salegens]
MNKLTISLVAVSALALTACAKKAPEQLPPAPESTYAPAPTPTQPAGPIPGSQGHFKQVMAGQDTIYFDTDKFNIDSEDAAALRSQAQYLLQYPQIRATIEGHCDERGTRDYNLALGERRANAAKNYLVSLGIPAARISTISYGKERPVALGSNEGAWAQNRRAVTVVLN